MLNRLVKTPGVVTPWESDPSTFHQSVARLLPYDALLLAIFDERRPQPDEVLALRGIPARVLERWCAAGPERLEPIASARRHGSATAAPGESADADMAKLGHVMAHVLPEPPPARRAWVLLLAQHERPYTEQEQRLAALMLRQWQVAFDQLQEPVVGRMLLGHDDRLIHADVWMRMQLLRHPQMLDQLLATLHAVVRQRWGDAAGDTATRDVVIELAGRPHWVRFHEGPAPELPAAARQLYLEVHPLEETELPAVGVLEDDRVARALAFIHDNFQHAPSLSEIARAAHVSPFHFHRLFTRQVGLSPKHYLQSKQLQVARWLLRASRAPIGAIAQQTGFSSHGHFTSTFHRIVGVSPSDFREGAERPNRLSRGRRPRQIGRAQEREAG